MLLSHNHGSVENYPKRKATFILEIHFGTQFTWKKDAGIPEPRKKQLTTFHWILVGSWGSFFWCMKIIPEKTWLNVFHPQNLYPKQPFLGPFFRDAHFESTTKTTPPGHAVMPETGPWKAEIVGPSVFGVFGCWVFAEEKYHGSWTIGFRGFFCGNFSWMNKIRLGWIDFSLFCQYWIS